MIALSERSSEKVSKRLQLGLRLIALFRAMQGSKIMHLGGSVLRNQVRLPGYRDAMSALHQKRMAHHMSGEKSLRSAIRPMAFLATKQSDTVTLPLDFYNLLKVNPGVSRESVTKAYER